MNQNTNIGMQFEDFTNGGGRLNFSGFTDYIEKAKKDYGTSKHKEYVDVTKNGKTFKQLREVGSKGEQKIIPNGITVTVTDSEGKKYDGVVKEYANDYYTVEIEGKDKTFDKNKVSVRTPEKQRRIQKAEDNNIEKALDSFDYSDKMSFKKTGKEIKEKLAGILTIVTTCKTTCETRMLAITEELKEFPTRPIEEYENRGIEKETAGLKMFEYCKTYFNPGERGCCVESNGSNVASATSKEEAALCSEYNSLVRKIIGYIKDVKKIGLFERNINDKEIYQLSTQQCSELSF